MRSRFFVWMPLPPEKMKIVILDAYTANPGDLSWDGLKALGEVEVYDRTSPSEVLSRAEGAEALLVNKVKITREVIESLPSLRYIGVLATGYNVVDLDAAKEHGIVVTNVPAYSTMSVAQMVFAHILNITNSVAHYSAEVDSGRWASSKDFCFYDSGLTELDGKTMGVVGLGNIGMAVARIGMALGMNVMAFSRKTEVELRELGIQKASTYEELFSASDILSLHCPLTYDTHHLVNAERLSLMRPGAILINTGRGPLVDEQALADALSAGRIAGAALDVLGDEPPGQENPLVSLPNCYITPHIAWATVEARERLIKIVADNIKAFIMGKPVNVVNV